MRGAGRSDIGGYNDGMPQSSRFISPLPGPTPLNAIRTLNTLGLLPLLLLAPVTTFAEVPPIEVHQVLSIKDAGDKTVALTLDACGGTYDASLLQNLIEQRIPATIFATRLWINRNATALATLRAHPDLFDIENHGARHVPPVIGRSVYNIPGSPDLEHVRAEVAGGAEAVERATGTKPRWYRGATALYDLEALHAIEAMGYHIAGFSVNADNGATLGRRQIVARLARVKSGDIIIAHMNRPASDTAEGLAIGLRALREQGFQFIKLRDADVRLTPETERHLAAASKAAR